MTEEKAKEPIICVHKNTAEIISEVHKVSLAEAAAAMYSTPGLTIPIKRGDAETDTGLLQIVPYLVVVRDGKILTYQRGLAGGEDRLHNQYSIGIGGHLNAIDCAMAANCEFIHPDTATPVSMCLTREFREELTVSDASRAQIFPVTWFYDDSNEVSSVHLCYLHVMLLPDDCEVEAADPAVSGVEWYSTYELKDMSDKLESWSNIALGLTEEFLQSIEAEENTTSEPEPVDSED